MAQQYRFFQAKEARRRSSSANNNNDTPRGRSRETGSQGARSAASGGGSRSPSPPDRRSAKNEGFFGRGSSFTNPYNLKPTESISMSKKDFRDFIQDIKTEGIKEPIYYVKYNGEKYVVNGHHRLRAAKSLGLRNVPIQEVSLPYKGYRKVGDLLNYFGP